MHACSCNARHSARYVVLTGGPGAGKTAVLEFMRLAFCRHVTILPEAAGVLFGGGFPRAAEPAKLRAVQRAIFHVQRELEESTVDDNAALVVCDRGTPDGSAYWPGPGTLWDAVGTTPETELDRYAAVIHLRTPTNQNGYNFNNPLRKESVEEALAIDAKIGEIWSLHPGYVEVPATEDFLVKARHALELLRHQVPPCCQGSVSRSFVV